ncbi:MAG: hypothetical protein JKY65_16400 [Planctomycetes bacterium]|nr:hypothetical protein [Planctomycetota bacterium]
MTQAAADLWIYSSQHASRAKDWPEALALGQEAFALARRSKSSVRFGARACLATAYRGLGNRQEAVRALGGDIDEGITRRGRYAHQAILAALDAGDVSLAKQRAKLGVKEHPDSQAILELLKEIKEREKNSKGSEGG